MNQPFNLTYKGIMEHLIKELTFSFTTTEDPEKFRKRLAQAKVRSGERDSRLSFDVKPAPEIEGAWVITVALIPSTTKTLKVLQVNSTNTL